MDKVLLRAQEVAEIIGLGKSKTYSLIQDGVIPSVRIGSAVRVPRAALEEWLRRLTSEGEGSVDGR